MTRDWANISNLLEKYNHFEECIIEDIRFRNYLGTVEIGLNYIYGLGTDIRKDIETKRILTLRFHLVESLKFRGGLSSENLKDFDNVNWSLNEIALVELRDPIESDQLKEVSILWEGDRRIDIKFLEFDIL